MRALTSTESLLVASQELFDELPVAVLVTNAAGTLLTAANGFQNAHRYLAP